MSEFYLLYNTKSDTVAAISGTNLAEFAEDAIMWWFDTDKSEQEKPYAYQLGLGQYSDQPEDELMKVIRTSVNVNRNVQILLNNDYQIHKVTQKLYDLHSAYFKKYPAQDTAIYHDITAKERFTYAQ